MHLRCIKNFLDKINMQCYNSGNIRILLGVLI